MMNPAGWTGGVAWQMFKNLRGSKYPRKEDHHERESKPEDFSHSMDV